MFLAWPPHVALRHSYTHCTKESGLGKENNCKERWWADGPWATKLQYLKLYNKVRSGKVSHPICSLNKLMCLSPSRFHNDSLGGEARWRQQWKEIEDLATHKLGAKLNFLRMIQLIIRIAPTSIVHLGIASKSAEIPPRKFECAQKSKVSCSGNRDDGLNWFGLIWVKLSWYHVILLVSHERVWRAKQPIDHSQKYSWHGQGLAAWCVVAVLFLPSFESRNGLDGSVDTAWCSPWKGCCYRQRRNLLCRWVDVLSHGNLHGNPRKLHVEIIVRHKQKDEPGSILQYSITCDAGVDGIGELPIEFGSHIEQRNLLQRTWIRAFLFNFILDLVAD